MKYQFLVIAANKMEGLNFADAVEVSVYAKTEKEAVDVVKKVTPKRKIYFVRKVVQIEEHQYPDYMPILKEMVKAMKNSK